MLYDKAGFKIKNSEQKDKKKIFKHLEIKHIIQIIQWLH